MNLRARLLGRSVVLVIAGTVAACGGGGGKKTTSSCAGDDACGGGVCYESSCYTACSSTDPCAVDQVCVSRPRDDSRVGICVVAADFYGGRKLDVVLVLDDSSSSGSCTIRQRVAPSVDRFIAGLEAQGPADLRLAVTTTNVCPADQGGATRGRFVYAPATSEPPGCAAQVPLECATDADCQAADLPDASHWACQASPLGTATCDAPGAPVEGVSEALYAFASVCLYRCDSTVEGSCSAVFGDERACVAPGGDASKSGCQAAPPTGVCPADGPTMLDDAVVGDWFAKWQDGSWAGDPAWQGQPEAVVRGLMRAALFGCMASVGGQQSTCGRQEQGLLAAWMALDRQGENSEQAQAFLRDDAALLVVVASDEDDCSTPEPLDVNQVSSCACLADTDGCPAGATDPATCTPSEPGPLLPATLAAAKLRALKADQNQVTLAVYSGDVVPGSVTTPGDDAAAMRERYTACKCGTKPTAGSTYACVGEAGRADLGARYLAAVDAFGARGRFANLCQARPDDALEAFGRWAATTLWAAE